MDIGSGINCEKQMEIASSILRTEAELRITSTRARHQGDPAHQSWTLGMFSRNTFLQVSLNYEYAWPSSLVLYLHWVCCHKGFIVSLTFSAWQKATIFPGFFSDTLSYIWYITIRLGIAASYYFCFSSLHDLSLIGNITSKNRWIVWETALEPLRTDCFNKVL